MDKEEFIEVISGISTPKPSKRDKDAMEMSPVGTFSLSDLSGLLDRKLKPIQEQLQALNRIPVLEESIRNLETENKLLQQRLLKCETYMKKNNIKIFGLKEKNNENTDDEVINVFKEFCPTFNNRTFTNVYRLGQKRAGVNRPILASFFHLKDKFLMQEQSAKIANKYEISFSDDYPQPVEIARKQLLPIFHVARKLHSSTDGVPKPKLKGDRLLIKGKPYTVTNLSKLPDHLKPEYIYTPSKNGITAFFTKHSPLSNHFSSRNGQFKVNGQEFNCMEQFFMSAKALEFGDTESYLNIMNEKDPVKMKRDGKLINGYDNEHWLSVCEEKILVGLTEKFRQNEDLKQFLLATGTDIIAEASFDKIYGIGKSLSSRDLFVKEKWSGKNIMGKLLMKVRDLLNTE